MDEHRTVCRNADLLHVLADRVFEERTALAKRALEIAVRDALIFVLRQRERRNSGRDRDHREDPDRGQMNASVFVQSRIAARVLACPQ